MTSPTNGPGVEATALQQVLLAHEAAVFGYPEIGIHLDDSARAAQVRALQQSHADRRDAIAALIAAAGVTEPTTTPVTPPFPAVTDAAAALRAAVAIEDRTASAYRYLLVARAAGSAADRTYALDALTTAARDATSWRSVLTPDRPTVPFAGTPA